MPGLLLGSRATSGRKQTAQMLPAWTWHWTNKTEKTRQGPWARVLERLRAWARRAWEGSEERGCRPESNCKQARERRQWQGARTRALKRLRTWSRREWTAHACRYWTVAWLEVVASSQTLAYLCLSRNQLATSAAHWSDNNATNEKVSTITHALALIIALASEYLSPRWLTSH